MDIECPFEIGQTVQHKASGEVGVVTAIHSRCVKHSQCEFMGIVSVSVGFRRDDIDVEAFLLAKAPAALPDPSEGNPRENPDAGRRQSEPLEGRVRGQGKAPGL